MTPTTIFRKNTRWLAAPLAALLTLLLLTVTVAVAQTDFGQPAPGQRIYDRAGVLSAEEIASLEAQAAAVEEAGAPAFVFLQPRDTDYDETVDDARDLMDAWNIQSADGAQDGIVIFFNLDPDDLEHGNYALLTGAALIEGNVPNRERDRIADEMASFLEDGDIAGAIGFALGALERDLREGPPPPPPPSRIETFADDVAGEAFSILNVIAVAITGAAAWLIARAMPKRRTSNAPVTPTTYPPDALRPGLAGALVAGTVSDASISATILDLAARGALVVEPNGNKKVRLRLLDESLVRDSYEQDLWRSLAINADADGILTDKQMGESRKDWGNIREVIKRDLLDRGWFDPNAGKQRTPFYLASVGFGVLVVVAVVFAAIAESFWALGAVAAFGIVSIYALVMGATITSTTPEGDAAAAPWRGYQQYLKSSGKNLQADLDLDTAVPYAVALGASTALDKRLKSASAEGYLPAWLGGSQTDAMWAGGFYPYWIAFNSTVAPSTSSTSTGSASSGSGASGGSF